MKTKYMNIALLLSCAIITQNVIGMDKENTPSSPRRPSATSAPLAVENEGSARIATSAGEVSTGFGSMVNAARSFDSSSSAPTPSATSLNTLATGFGSMVSAAGSSFAPAPITTSTDVDNIASSLGSLSTGFGSMVSAAASFSNSSFAPLTGHQASLSVEKNDAAIVIEKTDLQMLIEDGHFSEANHVLGTMSREQMGQDYMDSLFTTVNNIKNRDTTAQRELTLLLGKLSGFRSVDSSASSSTSLRSDESKRPKRSKSLSPRKKQDS